MIKKAPLACGVAVVLAGLALSPPVREAAFNEMGWADRQVAWTFSVLVIALGLAWILYATFTRRPFGALLRDAMRGHPRLVAAAFGLLVVVVLAVGSEGLFAVLDRGGPESDELFVAGNEEQFDVADPLLGYKASPNAQVTVGKTYGGKEVYRVQYTIDGAGRRVTPSSPPATKDRLTVFFGCSNTFGEGVNDDQTMPCYLAGAMPGETVYNYGFRGYGPQQMLAMLQDGRLDKVLAGKDVTAVFLFIDAHVARVAGSMAVVTSWAIDTPRYELDQADRPVFTGSFRASRPITNWFYALLSRSRTISHFNLDFPKVSNAQLHLTARIFEESARLIAAKSRASRFFLVLHPTVAAPERLKAQFTGPAVRVLDYTKLYPPYDHAYQIQGDWHPTPLAHRTVALKLAEDLRAAKFP